jgi:hypothetical protein
MIAKGCVLPALLAMAAACGDPLPRNDRATAREYGKSLPAVSRITAEVLMDQGFRIKADVHRNGDGRIDAERSDGGVTAALRSVEPERTEVRLRLDGLPAKVGEDLLDRITERVAAAAPTPPVLVLGALEAPYHGSLASCVAAAELAFLRRGLALTQREVAPERARLVSPGPQEVSEIKMAVEGPDRVRVLFEVGAETREQADALAAQLKEEFEQALAELR